MDLLEEEQIERMLIQFEKGDNSYFSILVSHLLDVVADELILYPQSQETILVGLLALLYAIKSYHSNQQEKGIPFIQKYIHLTLLVYGQNPIKLNKSTPTIYFPTRDITISDTDMQLYMDCIQRKLLKYEEKQKKLNEKTLKIS